MALPKQVEQQLKELEELERSLTVQTEEAQPEEPAVEQQSEVAAEAPQNVAPAPQPEVPEETWQQKYQSLKGHFDAEVPRLHQQNKELANQLQDMQRRIGEVEKAKEAVAEVEERLVTEQDEEAFGADLLDAARRAAKEEIRAAGKQYRVELSARDAKIAELEAALKRTGGEVSTMTFEQKLDREIPDFQQVNTDPKWIAWLDEIDGLTGEPRRGYAEYVYSQGNVAKLKKVVDAFKALNPQQDVQRQQRQAELNRQVQPARTASSGAVPQGERLYTTPEADRLWGKVKELYTKGQNDEAFKLETELSNAYAQGRIR